MLQKHEDREEDSGLTDESQTEGMTEFTPERWETAVEDAAEIVALLLDRGQAILDAFNELRRERPMLVSAAAAAVGGALIGTIVAGRRLRQRSRRPLGAVAQATAVAQAAAERLAQQQPLRSRLGVMREGRSGSRPQERLVEGGRAAQHLLQLLPVVVAVLKNPLVRTVLWRFAVRSVRR
ncbi:MAG: hypothetical protein HY534_06455 [Chloroflexi bacterium]|nr:hypothetical protein [Chloroflexota bacterium]